MYGPRAKYFPILPSHSVNKYILSPFKTFLTYLSQNCDFNMKILEIILISFTSKTHYIMHILLDVLYIFVINGTSQKSVF